MEQRQKILYVDDEKANVRTFELTFEDEYEIIGCFSGEEALERLGRESEIPVIVADQKMPGISGIEFLEKTIPLYPDAVRILLTAYTDRDLMLDAINTGRVYGYIVKPWNATEVGKILSEAMEKYRLVKENELLVQKLQEKIRELNQAQEQLLYQERRAMVGDLAAGLSHEIKNLLNPITLLQLIETDLSEEQKVYLRYIYDARDRISNLIEEVRRLARNEDFTCLLESNHVAECVEEAIFLARMDRDVRGKQIRTRFDYEGMASFNRNKIIQVLLNLIRNAAHAIEGLENGEIVVSVAEENGTVLVGVEDNGAGMDEDTQEKIWTPFYTTRGEKGTGIGLNICRKILECHRGSIRCFSQPGKGTRFVFSLFESVPSQV